MTALSDALTAAQRSALAALEKAYVADKIEPEALVASLEAAGISDPVDTAFLLAALDVLREWGVSAPTMTERVAEAKVEPASDKQLAFIERLCGETNHPVPDQVAGREPRSHFEAPGPDRWARRSRTLPGIAGAMAAQWGGLVKLAVAA